MAEGLCVTCRGFVRFQSLLRNPELDVYCDQNRATARWFVAALKAVHPCEPHPETLRLATALSAELDHGVTEQNTA